MVFRKIVTLCEKHGIFKKFAAPPDDFKVVIPSLKLGPVGTILSENLRNEWLHSSVTNRDFNVFLNSTSFIDTFEFAKNMCLERVPFGIAEIVRVQRMDRDRDKDVDNENESVNQAIEKDSKEQSSKEGVLDFTDYCVTNCDELLRNTMFVSRSNSTPFFHQWQRQRKFWWRKISASPGRYNLTDIQTDGNGRQSVEIKAEFSWSSQIVETISMFTGEHEILPSDLLQLRDGRKKMRSHFIVSDVSLSTMVLNMICDAYDEPPFQGDKRPMLRFHRKLAPYKITFALSSNVGAMNDLNDLALYLCKQFRANYISTLFVPHAPRATLESQFQNNDQMGIPYTIVLNDNTLKNGIAYMRNRDTSLKEQVHISTVLTYVQQILKNF